MKDVRKCCPTCGQVLPDTRGGVAAVIEHYYRRKARDRRVTLADIAAESEYSYQYLRQAKVDYDRAGKWGAGHKAKT